MMNDTFGEFPPSRAPAEAPAILLTFTTGGYAAASPPATIFQASGLVPQTPTSFQNKAREGSRRAVMIAARLYIEV